MRGGLRFSPGAAGLVSARLEDAARAAVALGDPSRQASFDAPWAASPHCVQPLPEPLDHHRHGVGGLQLPPRVAVTGSMAGRGGVTEKALAGSPALLSVPWPLGQLLCSSEHKQGAVPRPAPASQGRWGHSRNARDSRESF